MMAGKGTTQFINEKLAEETPIFSKVKVSFTPNHPLTHLVVSNNNIVMALANRTLLRIDQDTAPDKMEEIDLNKSATGAKISNLFLDPSGRHLLISLKPNDIDSQSELLYLPKKFSKPRTCAKFRGSLVSGVGFSCDSTSDSTTAPILVGTTLGLLIETELASDDRMFSREPELYYRQLYDIGKGQHVPITGLEYHNVPNTNKFYVLAATPQRLYQFQGYVGNSSDRPLLHHVFNNYLNKPAKFLEFPSSLKYSTLSMYYNTEGKRKFPTHFAWLTETGLYSGAVDPWETDNEIVTADCQLMSHPADLRLASQPTATMADIRPVPRNALVTRFHVLLLYADRVKSMCLLNEQVVFDDLYDTTHGNLVGIVHDQVKNVYWAYTDYGVYKYRVVDESRHIWRIFLSQGKFEEATKHCANEPAALDQIVTKQAEQLFSERKYVESAMHYAHTKASFEEVALRFMELEDKSALTNYLKKKLESLKSAEKTQITLIVLWLIELYQNKLGALREKGQEQSGNYQDTQAEFTNFLKLTRVEECVKNNRDTVYSLLGSHGDMDHLVHLAESLNDTERLVQYNLRNGDYECVLGTLLKQNSPHLLYQFCPRLLRQLPQQTVDALIGQGKKINPSKILPALMVATEAKEKVATKECIRFLEHSINTLQCEDQAVHNLLVSLYVAEHPHKILPYLSDRDREHVVDVKYLLKLCLGASLREEAVYLYTLLGQHEQAVELALTIHLDLAVRCAGGKLAGGPLNQDMNKKLWLRVAQHVVQEKQDIKQAMEFMHQCPSVKIEDILPFFPDFVTIDHFKSAIVESLQEYSKHIADLKAEMSEASRSAQVIRDEITQAKARYQFVRATDRCSSCGDLLLTRQFYLFSCSHRFHSGCLIDSISPHLAPARRKRVADLQSQLAQGLEETGSLDSRSCGQTRTEMAQQELTDIIAGECCYCGEMMIRDIDQPFIEDKLFDSAINDWL